MPEPQTPQVPPQPAPTPPSALEPPPARPGRRRWGETLGAYGFLAPAGAVLLVFWVLPVVLSVLVSFSNWHGGDTMADVGWVGLRNYQLALSDPRFFKAFWNTVNYALWSVPLTLALALALAMMMTLPIRGRAFFRTAFFLPYVTTWVAISIVWVYVFQQNFGMANYLLDDVLGLGRLKWLNESRGVIEMAVTGLGHTLGLLPEAEVVRLPHPLLQGPSLSLFALIITSVWRDAGYFMVILLAGLQTIDASYYEAAAIDGAGPWQRFRHITFPLLSPVTFFCLIIAMIGAFKVYVPVMVMTPDGGPSYSTATIVYFLYEEGFLSWRLGYASAIAYILFIIILALTLVQNRVVGRRVHYQ